MRKCQPISTRTRLVTPHARAESNVTEISRRLHGHRHSSRLMKKTNRTINDSSIALVTQAMVFRANARYTRTMTACTCFMYLRSKQFIDSSMRACLKALAAEVRRRALGGSTYFTSYLSTRYRVFDQMLKAFGSRRSCGNVAGARSWPSKLRHPTKGTGGRYC